MTAIPQHEANAKPARTKKARLAVADKPAHQPTEVVVNGPPDPDAPWHARRPIKHDIEIDRVAGLGAVATNLDWIGDAVARLTSDDSSVSVLLGQNRYAGPVQVTLADNDNDDTMDRLVTAFERIADSIAKLAGLTRPRLESWHEQDEYEPRNKDQACDGGAPGPKKAA